MIKVVFNRSALWVTLLTTCLAPGLSHSATSTSNSICTPTGIIVGFFNGVNTSEAKAILARQSLLSQYGTTAPVSGEKIQYEYFYNHSEGLSADALETLNLRLAEVDSRLKDRWDLISATANGNTSWIDKFATISSALGQQIIDKVTGWQNGAITTLVGWFVAQPTSTSGDLTSHKLKLDKYMTEGKKFVLVAHSEGNLFANRAYHYVTAQGQYMAVAQVVHVAPASTEVNGPYIRGDLDLVIGGLAEAQSAGSVKPSNWPMVGYALRAPDDILNETDWMGHGFFEIYFNPNKSGAMETGRVHFGSLFASTLNTVDMTARPNSRQLTDGFFTVTMTWNIAGDVDLHVLEPDGTHVFFGQFQGHSGFLDRDDTVATGPEHYFASCDGTALQTGVYSIGVRNYGDLTPSVAATVRVYDNNQQLLGTWTALPGAATYSSAMPSTLFKLNVSKDSMGTWTVAPVGGI